MSKIVKPVSVLDPYGIYDGAFVIVETDEETYLGVLSYPTSHTLRITTGLPGRPVILQAADVDAITPAENHPDVIPA